MVAMEDFFAYPVANTCETCERLDRAAGTRCEAFPDGIPTVILLGYYDHTLPYFDGEADDQGLQYAPRDGTEL